MIDATTSERKFDLLRSQAEKLVTGQPDTPSISIMPRKKKTPGSPASASPKNGIHRHPGGSHCP